MSSLDLPSFSDRLPDLVQALRAAGRDLTLSKPTQSYLPYFEDIYSVAHSLKGVLGILNCPQPMAGFIVALNEELMRALAGNFVCRKNPDAGNLFLLVADALDQERAAETADLALLNKQLAALASLYSEDVDHQTRMKDVPAHLFHVSQLVSKRAREIPLLGLNFCVVEEEIRLDGIPLWRAQLNEALLSPEFGRGIVVNFLPFLSPEQSRILKLWAWVAAASHSRAELKQRIKEVMPKASITKL